jgi:Ras-related protein Rab-5C
VPFLPSFQNSFLQAKTWVEFLRNTQLSGLDNQRVVIAFVGNKMDLADERREVDRREAEVKALNSPTYDYIVVVVVQSYAAGNDLIFMESSAKSSLNVQELFHKIGQSLLKKERLRMAEEDEAKSGAGAGTGGARRSRNINGTEGGRGGGGGLGGIVLSRVEAEWQGARQQMQQNGCCS